MLILKYPGASLGTLVSAIKDGVKNAVGLDLIPYANNYKLNKRIIDELIPKNKFPKLNMNLSIELGNLSNTFSNNRIKSISNILPVLKSPTVLPLEKDGWSSLHSVINEDKFWEVIDKLKEEGAEDILVCPIEKMVL